MKKFNRLAMAAALSLLAACSRTTTRTEPVTAAEKESAAEAKICKKMADKTPNINQYPAVTPETPLNSLKDANDKVAAAIKDVEQSAQNVNNPDLLQASRVLDVESAYQKLQDAVNTVPGGRETVGDASNSISTNAQALKDAWTQMYQGMQCGA
jgi:hypothetical protein